MHVSKKINLYGGIVWVFLFFILVPMKLIIQYPIVLIGYIYTLFILLVNYLLIGNKIDNLEEQDFKDVYKVGSFINTKAFQISTAIFALSVSAKNIFKIEFNKYILLFIIYTLIFGVGIVLPSYFVSNQQNNNTTLINRSLIRLRNVSISYSIGFMISGFMIILQKLLESLYS
jgi:hypothetical protein|tara:strand:- start:1679 stop:2197 length:519 start_codon:yes stop_codon:yes gene_type:complete